jgi:hypothetical protein
MTCPEYLAKVDQSYLKEKLRAEQYLEPKTKELILKIVIDETIENRAEELLDMESGYFAMFKDNQIQQLGLMYRLFKKANTAIGHLLNKMQSYIEERGIKIVKDPELVKDAIKFISNLLDFKN